MVVRESCWGEARLWGSDAGLGGGPAGLFTAAAVTWPVEQAVSMNPMSRSRSPAASAAEQPAESMRATSRRTTKPGSSPSRWPAYRGVYDLEVVCDVVPAALSGRSFTHSGSLSETDQTIRQNPQPPLQ